MQMQDKLVVVTGGGGGIGGAMARRFAREGARLVVVADVNGEAATAVAEDIGGISVVADLGTEAGCIEVVRVAEEQGPIDLLCLNAGIAIGGGVETPDEDWYRIWDINVMAHVWTVRAALPAMLARGEGHLLITASAAGLLTNIGAAPYSATKHAAVGLAEWLAITHGDDGITVSCLCPQGVRTKMLFPDDEEGDEAGLRGPNGDTGLRGPNGDTGLRGPNGDIGANTVRSQGVIEPEEVADAVIRGLDEGRFLILPHPEVLDYFQLKAGDYDRWLGGMRKLQRRTQG